MAASKKSSTETAFDDLHHYVSSFGVYQIILFFGSCSLAMQICSYYALLVFVMGTPNFHCEPTTNSATNITCNPNQCCSNCTEYVFDGPFTSIVNEWNLLCNDAYKQAIIRSCFYVGDIVGSIIFGIISDNYGRKKTMFVGTAIMVFFAFGSSFSQSPVVMGFLWFVTGLGVSGVIVSQAVYFMEIVGPKYRTFASTAYDAHWSIGAFGSAVLAYFIRDWRTLTIVCSLPAMLLLFTWKFVPETPRWLLAHGHVDESLRVLQKYGSKDKNNPAKPERLRAILENVRANQVNVEKVGRTYTILDLIRTQKIRKWTLAVCFQCFALTNLTHGMNLYIPSLSGDLYVNFLIVNSLSLPVYVIYFFIVRRFGRRLTYGFTLLITSLLCFIAVMLPNDYGLAKTVFFLTASRLIIGAWVILTLFVSELFPTVLRNKVQGLSSMTGRIGGLVTPYVDLLARLPGVDKFAPVIIFTIISLCAAVITYWIPETMNTNMHQTIEEAEAAPENYDILCCKKPPPLTTRVELEFSEGEKMLETAEPEEK